MSSFRAPSNHSVKRRSLLKSGSLAALSIPALGALSACGDGDAGDGTGGLPHV